MNKRSVIISALIAGLAVLVTNSFISSVIKNRIGDYEEQEIVVATKDIPQNTLITTVMIASQKVPKRFIQPTAARDIGAVDRKMAVIHIHAGEQILRSMVVPPEETNIAISRIPVGGYRAITMGVRDPQGVVAVGGLVQPGNFVDILLTLFYNTQITPEKNELFGAAKVLKGEVRMLFQNIRILAVGRDFGLTASALKRNIDEVRRDTQEVITNVTVALPPADVQKLVLAQTLGRLTLALRRHGDDEIVQIPIEDAITAFGVKMPIEQGPSPYYREYQGGNVVRTPF